MLWLAGEHCPRSKLMEPTVASEEEGFCWRWRTRSMCVCVCFGNDCPIFAPRANVIFFSPLAEENRRELRRFRLTVARYMLFPRNVPRPGFLNLPTSPVGGPPRSDYVLKKR